MDLNAISVFTQVVDCGSFTQAAHALHMTKSTVSRKLGELEQHLGVRLITRSTRSLVLTPEGERFYQSCLQAQEIISQAELEVSANQDLIRGRLSVVLPVELSHQVLAPYINRFLKAHPNVTIHLETTNREVDIIAEGIDLYAQIGELADSSLVSRHLTKSKRALVASREYTENYGSILSHQDLKPPHQMIEVNNRAVKLPNWHLKTPEGEPIWIDLPSQLKVNTITSCLKACLDGLGVAVLPEFICREHFKSGKLVQLLPGYTTPEVSVSLVYADRELMPKRKKALIEYLLEEFAADPRAN